MGNELGAITTSGDSRWSRDGYASAEDEYPAVLQEWKAAANTGPENYIPQVPEQTSTDDF